MTQELLQSICPDGQPLELDVEPLEEDEELPEDELLEDDPPDDEEVEEEGQSIQVQREGSKARQPMLTQSIAVKLQVQVLL